eukprot:12468052-Alexandrium_andersonii.AAC.1
MDDCAPEAQVRVLADDLLLLTGLQDQADDATIAEVHGRALDITLEFMDDMGARNSASKTKTLATTPGLRSRLKRMLFGPQRQCFPV